MNISNETQEVLATKKIIDAYYSENQIMLPKLDALGYNRHHLNRLFEKQYDMSIKQYINLVRFEKSKELLMDGMKITDIALRVGLDNSASFATFFRKQAGMSASEYINSELSICPHCYYETPVGALKISEGKSGITGIHFVDDVLNDAHEIGSGQYLETAVKQLDEYFHGNRKKFDVPLETYGSDFQKEVWNNLVTIPYGETRCYKDVAEMVGNSKASRAVGMANNRNPILIMIPCHRVVGKDNKLVGYAGGIERKAYLLKMEGVNYE